MSEAESLRSVCPQCGKRLRLKAALTGKRLTCPSCSHSFVAQPVLGAPEHAPPPRRTAGIPWTLVGVASVSFVLVSTLAYLWFGASSEVKQLRDRLALSEDQSRDSSSAGEQKGAEIEKVSDRLKQLKADAIRTRDRLLTAEKQARQADAVTKVNATLLAEEREKAKTTEADLSATRDRVAALTRKLEEVAEQREVDRKLLEDGREQLKALKYRPIPVYTRGEGVGTIQVGATGVALGRGVVAEISPGASLTDGRWEVKAKDAFFNVSRGTRVQVGEHELEPGECAVYQFNEYAQFHKLHVAFGHKDADEKAVQAVREAGGLADWDTFTIGNPLVAVNLGKSTPDLMKTLAATKYLHTVRFGKEKVTAEVFRGLAGCKKLATVALVESEFLAADLKELAGVKKLQNLHLRGPRVTDDLVAALGDLASRGGLEQLVSLHLVESKVTGKGLAAFAGLKKLRMLVLDYSPVTDEALKEIGRLALSELNLKNTAVTDEGLKHLAGHKLLKQVSLDGTRVTAAGAAGLRTALPTCLVIFNSEK